LSSGESDRGAKGAQAEGRAEQGRGLVERDDQVRGFDAPSGYGVVMRCVHSCGWRRSPHSKPKEEGA